MCMKKTLLFVCGLLMCMSMQAADFENAKDAVKFMGVGWNLGNTLDAANWEGKDGWNFASTEAHETFWGQPVTKPELIDGGCWIQDDPRASHLVPGDG